MNFICKLLSTYLKIAKQYVHYNILFIISNYLQGWQVKLFQEIKMVEICFSSEEFSKDRLRSTNFPLSITRLPAHIKWCSRTKLNIMLIVDTKPYISKQTRNDN